MDEQPASTPGMTASPDAIALLRMEHRQVRMQFDAFDNMQGSASPEEKFEVAKKVCGELLIHMAIEEAIFYPAVRQCIAEDDLMDEAEDDHDKAKDLIRELGEIKPSDPAFDARMTELIEVIDLHIDEEESEMFPKVLVSEMDIAAIGHELMTARDEMRSRLGLPPA